MALDMKTRAPYPLNRMIALVAIISALSSTTFAAPPDAPSAVKQRQLAAATTPLTSSSKSEQQQFVSTPKKVDSKYSIKTLPFALAIGVMAAGTVADVETTVGALNRCKNSHEVNSWIYGKRPTRGRMYAINLPIMAAVTWLAAKNKQDKKAGDFHAMWPITPLITGGVHAIAAAHNAGVQCR
jgi:hypothetical protein